jgi:hypothetical protein
MQAELYMKLQEAALTQLREYKQLPDRDEIVDRLNRYAPVLASYLGVKVVFI